MTHSLSDLADSFVNAAQKPAASLGHLATEALDQFSNSVNGHKSAGVEAIASVARSAREAASGFEAQSPEVARLVRKAADHVERVSTSLQEQNLGDLARSMTEFAQARPKLFIGGGILAGFVLARLLFHNDVATPAWAPEKRL